MRLSGRVTMRRSVSAVRLPGLAVRSSVRVMVVHLQRSSQRVSARAHSLAKLSFAWHSLSKRKQRTTRLEAEGQHEDALHEVPQRLGAP